MRRIATILLLRAFMFNLFGYQYFASCLVNTYCGRKIGAFIAGKLKLEK